MKKLVSLIMAVAMMATMTITAFAEDPAPSLTANGTVQIPTIDVTVNGATSGAGSMFINPYGFKVKLADATLKALDDSTTTDAQMTTDKVFSPIFWLENNTTVGIDVYVNGSATIGSGSTMTLAKDTLAPGSTKKEALVYVAFGTVALNEAKDAATGLTPTTATFSATTPGSNFLIGIAEAKEAQKVGTMAASTSSAKSTLGFRFSGDAVSEPKEAWDSTKDTVTTKLFFTYKPAAATTGSGT